MHTLICKRRREIGQPETDWIASYWRAEFPGAPEPLPAPDPLPGPESILAG